MRVLKDDLNEILKGAIIGFFTVRYRGESI